jgi:hypothetical protein
MNIFILDYDIETAAKYHCDKHVVKMITESAQILCTVLHQNKIDAHYKMTHIHHPCTIWAGESLSNYLWLKELLINLYDEYKHRYGSHKRHKAAEIGLQLPNPWIHDYGLTEFAQAMPDKYKHKDAVTAYRNYYLGEKQHILQYKNREMPEWVMKAL